MAAQELNSVYDTPCEYCGSYDCPSGPECPKYPDANLRNAVAIEDNLKTEAPIERKGPKT